MNVSPQNHDSGRPKWARREWLMQLAMASGAIATAQMAQAAPPKPEPLPVWTPVPQPPQAPAQEGWVDVGDGARLWYWDTGGAGPAVVLMHAGSQSAAGWVYQQPVFAAAGFRTIGYSRRGYFRSQGATPEHPGMASEDLHQLLKHLQLSKVHLVAIAHGAFFAVDFALTHPDMLLSLTLASSYLGIDDSETDYLEANERLRPKEFNALPVSFKELHPSYRMGNPAGTAAWVQLHKEATQGPRIPARRPYPLTWARLESITLPTLLLTGDGDLYTPPALLRMQAQHLRHAEMVIIREAGHSANWEQPAAFNQAVLGFIGRHRP